MTSCLYKASCRKDGSLLEARANYLSTAPSYIIGDVTAETFTMLWASRREGKEGSRLSIPAIPVPPMPFTSIAPAVMPSTTLAPLHERDWVQQRWPHILSTPALESVA